ncbi:MAG: HU family DNA-binding protein [Candidatus Hodarchaeales archaeon]
MTYQKFIEHLQPRLKMYDGIEMSKSDIKGFIEMFSGLLVETSKAEGGIRIPSMGTFSVKRRKARMGNNPATGEQIKIAAKNALVFKPSSDVKKILN